MRDEELDERGFNPIRFGIIGALIIAACVASLLLFRSYSESKATQEREQSARELEIQKLQKENAQLKAKGQTLEHDSQSTASALKKALQLRETQLANLKKQKEQEGRSQDAKITEINQQRAKIEAQMKKDGAEQDQMMKKMQDQIAKLQTDLKSAKSDAARFQQSYNALQNKMNQLNEGDQSAADAMVEQLAQARQELKREQAARKRLEDQLEALQGQPAPPQQ